jgi:WD40 repeat protein/serine/threonine protein kinase
VVYRAQQVSVRRTVALKILLESTVADRAAYVRFQIEADAVARLEHPNIVPLHGFGRHQGTPFLVLRFFEHGSLADALRTRRFTPKSAARLISTAAHAIHHAHQRGVIHRDLKPSNIMLDAADAPFVADFGLARLLDDDAHPTRTASTMGTPAYMAPEQTLGDGTPVGTPADIHALGSILFELITGHPPFLASTPLETLRKVADHDPPDPSRTHPGTDPDLAAICLHCLEKSPDRRYTSAAALANDLDRWLRHEPISARPASTASRLAKWARRHPATATLAATLLPALLAGLVTTSWQWRRATRNEQRTAQMLYAANMSLAQADWQSDNLTRLRQLLEETADSPERGFEWFYWQHQANQQTTRFQAHTGAVNDLHFSHDGRTLATAGEDSTVKTWILPDGHPASILPHPAPLHSVRFSPDNLSLLTGDSLGTVRLWDLPSALPKLAFSAHERPVTAIFSPDASTILTAGWDETVKAWDASTGTLRFSARQHSARVKCIAVTPDGRTILTGGEDRTIRFWDAHTGEHLRAIHAHQGDVNAISIAPDGTRFASAGYDARIKFWSLPEASELASLTRPNFKVSWVSWANDGRHLASCSIYNHYAPWVWTTSHPWPASKLPPHATGISRIAFSPDNSRIVTACVDGSVRLWPAVPASGNLGEPAEGNQFILSPSGRLALLLRANHLASLLHTASNSPLRNLPNITTPIAFSPDESLLAAAQPAASTLAVLTPHDPTPTRVLHDLPHPLLDLTFSLDASVIACSGTNHCEIRDARTGATLQHLPNTRGPVHFGPLPDLLITGSSEGWMLWHWPSATPKTGWPALSAPTHAIAFNTTHIATIGTHGTIEIRSPQGRLLRSLPQVHGETHHMAFSPDGRRLAVASAWGQIEIPVWDVDSGTQHVVLEGHTGFIRSIRFSLDGRRLLTSSTDGSVRLWDANSGRELLQLPPPETSHPQPYFPVHAQFIDNDSAIVATYPHGLARRWIRASNAQVAAWESSEPGRARIPPRWP